MTHRKRNVATGKQQTGAALLVMMLIVLVGVSTLMVKQLGRDGDRLARADQTAMTLATARDALLAFASASALANPGSPLLLPCPDIDATGPGLDGDAHSANCGTNGMSVIGRFPWRTVGVGSQRDGVGECIWYAVSGEYKMAPAALSPMINPDTNGQFVVFQQETGQVIEGVAPDRRVAALLIAPGEALPGQGRQSITGAEQQCSPDFTPADFLDNDPTTGISNATLTGSVGIDQFIRAAGSSETVNDKIAVVLRSDIADIAYDVHGAENNLQALTQVLAECVANYGLTNPGGASDLRLPGPAPLSMTDYRFDAAYDDVSAGIYSGRLSDIVDDANSATGNATNRVFSDCDSIAVPGWTPAQFALWQDWKDHFFYYVSEAFSPTAPVPNNCGNCLSVNGTGQYAAIILFSNRRLQTLSQLRNAPPIDIDTKGVLANYLEGRNESGHPYTTGSIDLESQASTLTFNDYLSCIDPSMTVLPC